jgi:hypothetical protein
MILSAGKKLFGFVRENRVQYGQEKQWACNYESPPLARLAGGR